MLDYKLEPYPRTQDEAEKKRWREKKEEKGARFYSQFGKVTMLYALLFTFCLFKNASGVMVPVWIVGTIALCYNTFKKLEVTLAKGNWMLVGFLFLLGVSCMTTQNKYILCLNYVGFLLLIVYFLLHNIYDDRQWTFLKTLSQLVGSIFASIGWIGVPFADYNAYIKSDLEDAERKKKRNSIFLGLLLAVPALIVLGALLFSADLVFQKLTLSWVGIDGLGNVLLIILMLLFGYFSSYCGIRLISSKSISGEMKILKKRNPTTIITLSICVLVLYVMFCGIQIVYLFAGNMSLPEGVTYAQYARTGFFQLLFVAVVNFIFVLTTKHLCEQKRVLDVSLILICLCTFVMIASSAFRMSLYIQTYRLTFLRVFVLVALALLAILMLGTICYIVKPSFPIFHYSMIVVSVVYLVFSFSHVDYQIADYNLNTNTSKEAIDLNYISQLSLDAEPVIRAYVKEQQKNNAYLDQKVTQLKTKDKLSMKHLPYVTGDTEMNGYTIVPSDYAMYLSYEDEKGNRYDGSGYEEEHGRVRTSDYTDREGVFHEGKVSSKKEVLKWQQSEDVFFAKLYSTYTLYLFRNQKQLNKNGIRTFNLARHVARKHVKAEFRFVK